jgi:tetratricopeptide (TPR) repeat protein
MYAGAALAVVYGVVAGMTRHALAGGILYGVIAGLVWLWMAWKSNAGRNWARALSSVFFGTTIPGLLASVADRRWTPALGLFVIECGVGLAAVILLWRPESSRFFAAVRQAKLTAVSVPPNPGAADPAGTQGPGDQRLAEAIPLYERTLADREQVLGDNDPDTLTSRNNLASAYYEVGRLAEAIPLYERAFADREQLLGDTHPNTLTSRNNLALAYRTAGRLAEVEDLQRRTERKS